jgi:hypothetical protein
LPRRTFSKPADQVNPGYWSRGCATFYAGGAPATTAPQHQFILHASRNFFKNAFASATTA